MKSRAPRKSCAYCRSTFYLTKDHIPPRGLFPDHRAHRQGLITVPACGRCNKKFQKDDEYFCLAVAAHKLTGTNPIANTLHERAKRGLARAFTMPWGRKLSREIGEVELRTPSGVYAGKQAIWNTDKEIIDRVTCRILRGLHFHHFNRPVPKDSNVEGHALIDIPQRTDSHNAIYAPIKDLLRDQPLHDIGPGVFKYRFGTASDNSDYSFWAMTLYEAVEFMGYIEPNTSD